MTRVDREYLALLQLSVTRWSPRPFPPRLPRQSYRCSNFMRFHGIELYHYTLLHVECSDIKAAQDCRIHRSTLQELFDTWNTVPWFKLSSFMEILYIVYIQMTINMLSRLSRRDIIVYDFFFIFIFPSISLLYFITTTTYFHWIIFKGVIILNHLFFLPKRASFFIIIQF